MIAAASRRFRRHAAQNPAYRPVRYFSITYRQFWRNCAITVTRVFVLDSLLIAACSNRAYNELVVPNRQFGSKLEGTKFRAWVSLEMLGWYLSEYKAFRKSEWHIQISSESRGYS